MTEPESDLLEEVGDGQCCWSERGEVAHVVTDAHPFEPFLFLLVPCSVTFSLW